MIEVENPLRAEESVLRPSLLPGVLRAVAFNAAHSEPAVAVFESGTVFGRPREGEILPQESLHLAFARSHTVRRVPHEPNRVIDVYDATAVIHALMQELRIANCRLEAAILDGYHPGRAARLVVDGVAIGAVGEVARGVLRELDLAGPVIAGELDVEALVRASRLPRFSSGLSRFPASTIDLAFVVDDTVPAGAIIETLVTTGGELLESVDCFDVFRSETLGPGRVSLAFALQFRAADRTLTDDEVGTLRQACIDAVRSAHRAELRA